MKRNPTIGYYIMLEGTEGPNELLNIVTEIEDAGFKYLGASDHFHPWRNKRTYATFPWAWMTSALEKTEELTLGSGVTCPILRYHPAIVAQAFASMDHIYQGRVYLSVGTGESLNEAPLGYEWPPYEERKERLAEAISIIRQLWKGGFTNFEGNYFTLSKAKLYTPPKGTIPIYVAGEGPKSANIAGKYGDGFYTVLPPTKTVKKTLLPSFREGAKEKGKNPNNLEKIAQVSMAYSPEYEKALEACLSWPSNPAFFDHFFTGEYDPKVGDNLEQKVTDKQVKEHNYIVTNAEEMISAFEKVLRLGFTKILINDKSPDRLSLIKLCKEKVLPYFGA